MGMNRIFVIQFQKTLWHTKKELVYLAVVVGQLQL